MKATLALAEEEFVSTYSFVVSFNQNTEQENQEQEDEETVQASSEPVVEVPQ